MYCAYCFSHCSSFSGPIKEQFSVGMVLEKKPFEPSIPFPSHAQRDHVAARSHQFNHVPAHVYIYIFYMHYYDCYFFARYIDAYIYF